MGNYTQLLLEPAILLSPIPKTCPLPVPFPPHSRYPHTWAPALFCVREPQSCPGGSEHGNPTRPLLETLCCLPPPLQPPPRIKFKLDWQARPCPTPSPSLWVHSRARQKALPLSQPPCAWYPLSEGPIPLSTANTCPRKPREPSPCPLIRL